MKDLSSAGIAISLVSGFLFLALVAQVYYLVWWKKKKRRAGKRQVLEEEEESSSSSSVVSTGGKELLYLFCWKKPSFLSSTALNLQPQEICSSNNPDGSVLDLPFGEEGIEAELMRLHSLSGPPRFLFTIKEETKEELQEYSDQDGSRRNNSKGKKSLSDMLAADHTPYSSPPPPPPPPPLDYYSHQGFNPLFESFKADNGHLSRIRPNSSSSSPPPKFKFLRDAEEKLYKKILTEEAMRVHKCSTSTTTTDLPPPPPPPAAAAAKGIEDSDDGSFITIVIGKNHPNSSQVNPLPSSPPPPIIRAEHGKQ